MTTPTGDGKRPGRTPRGCSGRMAGVSSGECVARGAADRSAGHRRAPRAAPDGAGIAGILVEATRSDVATLTQSVRFGRHRFDPRTGRLWSGKQEVRLTPKAAAVLAVLVVRAGQPVTRREVPRRSGATRS